MINWTADKFENTCPGFQVIKYNEGIQGSENATPTNN